MALELVSVWTHSSQWSPRSGTGSPLPKQIMGRLPSGSAKATRSGVFEPCSLIAFAGPAAAKTSAISRHRVPRNDLSFPKALITRAPFESHLMACRAGVHKPNNHQLDTRNGSFTPAQLRPAGREYALPGSVASLQLFRSCGSCCLWLELSS